MKQEIKKISAFFLSVVMVLGTIPLIPAAFQKNVWALTDENIEESLVTEFSYDFAYTTPGYADGTICISAKEDGVYKIFWGDDEGNLLTKNGYKYSYLARIIVRDGKGSYNIISDYTVIPENAATVLIYKKNTLQYVYEIPEERLFTPTGEGYTFGALSDLHFGRYATVYEDDAVPAVDNAFKFLDSVGVDFVGITGDLTSEGEQASLDKYNTAIDKYPDMTVLSCTGNHDSRATVSTSDKSVLDTSLIRWYNSLTSNYFTVNEEGTYVSNLDGKYEITSIGTPLTTEYRDVAEADIHTKEIPALDFTVTDGENVFIFFNEISKTGTTYDVDKLLKTEQLEWLAEQLEVNKDKKVFLFAHSYLPINTLNNDTIDNDNCTGDLKNVGGYSYDLDFKDYVTTTDGENIQTLLTKYDNVTMFSGHSHWQYAMQEINQGLNIGKLGNGKGATLIHLSSVTEPRYIGRDDVGRTELNGYASEGTVVTIYDDCIVYNGVDFYNGQYEAYAAYIVPLEEDSQFEPVKDTTYLAATDVVTGDEYLESEDMTLVQLLKSTYNLTLGASYTYTSKGDENTDGALTDGVSTGTAFVCTKPNKKSEQCMTIMLEGVQEVSNLKSFMIYFVNGLTDCSDFNIELSLDGENWETAGIYTAMTYKDTELAVDTSALIIEQFKYVRVNLCGGTKAYGYQIKEFAAIGYQRNSTPNTAGSSSSLSEGTIDEEDYLDTDYNLVYGAEYTQSSVGGEDTAGALTNGKTSGGFMNTERSSSAKKQEIVIDMGKENKQPVNNIDYLLLYNQNSLTNVTHFSVSVSLDGEIYETIGNYSNIDVDIVHFDVDLSEVTLKEFRYVKLNFIHGNTNYGYQIKEFAVIGVNPIEYTEIPDQSANVASKKKNIALNKKLIVSSTYAKEGSNPTVLNDGKKDKYWSSDWDSTRTFDYVIIDLEEEVHTSEIDSVLVNYKSNNTYCDNYTIEFSKTYNGEDSTEGFYEVAKTKASSWEILQKKSDPNGYVVTKITEVEPDTVRYVKINMNGHAPYGFQIYEIAILVKEKTMTSVSTKISIENTEFTYTGSEIEPAISVTFEGINLTEGTDYSLSFSNNINAGIATVTVEGMGDFTEAATAEFTINPAPIENVTIDASNLKDFEFEGKDKTPIIILNHNGKQLNILADYEMKYENNFYPGTAVITITGIANYKGEIVRTFNIVKKPIGNVTIRTSFDTNNQLVVTVNNGSTSMTIDEDYTYSTVTDDVGKITITFTGMGDNYTGTFVKVIEAKNNPNAPKEITTIQQETTKVSVAKTKVKKATKKKTAKKIKISLKKIKGAGKYQVKISKSKKFKKKNILIEKTVKKSTFTINSKKIKNKKTLYVKARAIKVVKEKTYYGEWSTVKKVKISKY